MSQKKESKPKPDERPKVIIEHDSCYRGRIEVHRCADTGKVLKMDIIR